MTFFVDTRTDVQRLEQCECAWDKQRNEPTQNEVDDMDITTDMSVPKNITPIHTLYKSNKNNATHNDVKAQL